MEKIQTHMLGGIVEAEVERGVPPAAAPVPVPAANPFSEEEMAALVKNAAHVRNIAAALLRGYHLPEEWPHGQSPQVDSVWRLSDGAMVRVVKGRDAARIRKVLSEKNARSFWNLPARIPNNRMEMHRDVQGYDGYFDLVLVDSIPDDMDALLARAAEEERLAEVEKERLRQEGLRKLRMVPLPGEWRLADAGSGNAADHYSITPPNGRLTMLNRLEPDVLAFHRAMWRLIPSMAKWGLGVKDPAALRALEAKVTGAVETYGHCEELRQVIINYDYNFEGCVKEMARRRSWSCVVTKSNIPASVALRRVAEVGRERGDSREDTAAFLKSFDSEGNWVYQENECKKMVQRVGYDWLVESYAARPKARPLSNKTPVDLMLDEYFPDPPAASVPLPAEVAVDPALKADYLDYLKFRKRREQAAKRKAAKNGHPAP